MLHQYAAVVTAIVVVVVVAVVVIIVIRVLVMTVVMVVHVQLLMGTSCYNPWEGRWCTSCWAVLGVAM